MACYRLPQLDARLSTALRMAGKAKIAADIGADHGRLSLALLNSGRSEHVLVSDISEKSLLKARQLLCRHGQEQRATFAVADGLSALDALPEQKADTIFLLGMGGETLRGILLAGFSRLRGAALVLGAQTEVPLLRQTVCQIGYRIREEEIAWDGGRAYVLLRCTPMLEREPEHDRRELFLGPVLLQKQPPPWLPLLLRQKELLCASCAAMEKAGRDKDLPRLAKAREELVWVEEAVRRYGPQ